MTKRKNTMILSLRSLATRLHRSHTAVGRWVKDDRWVFGSPPWPVKLVPQIEKWAADNLQEDRSAGIGGDDDVAIAPGGDLAVAVKTLPTIRRVKAELSLARLANLRLDRAISMSALIPRKDAEELHRRQSEAIKDAVMGMMDLAPSLEGKGVAEAMQILEGWARGVCRKFAGENGVGEQGKLEGVESHSTPVQPAKETHELS